MSDEQLIRKIDKLIDKIDANNSSGGRSYGGNTQRNNNDDGEMSGLLGKVKEGLKDTILGAGNFVGKAVDNSATISDATGMAAGVLRKFGGAGEIAGTALTGITDIVTKAVGNWQEFSNFGLQFGGNAMGLRDAVHKTGLTFESYGSILEQLTPGFAAFGQGMTKGAEMFGELSNKLLNDQALQRQFNLLGMNTKDVNTALATVVRGANQINTQNEAQMNGLLASAVQLGREMDQMAKLTGVSRKEQEKAIETMQQDERVRAQIILLRKQNPAAVADIGKVQQAAKALDPATQKVLMEAVAGKGIMTSDKIAEFQKVYGPDAARQIAEIGRNVTSQDAKLREKAIKDTENLIFKLAEEREKGAAFVASGAVSNEFSKEAMGDRYEIITKNVEEYVKQGMSIPNARIKALKDAEALGSGKLTKDLLGPDGKTVIAKAGEDDPRAKTTELVTNINTDFKRFGAGLSEIITEINNRITTIKGKDGKNVINNAVNDTAGYNKNMGSRIKDLTDSVKLEIQGIDKDFGDKVGTSIATKLADMFGKRESGSKQTTGKWFESGPKPILMGEKGKSEAVVPEDQMDDFIRDAMFIATGASMNTPKLSRPNMSGLLKNVTAKVSSAQPAESQSTTESASQTSGQDPVLEKLDKISTIMERVAQHSERTERHVSDTASNTKDIGPYIR